jgi:hypothetical protein
MAFTVQGNTQVVGANAYIDLAFFKAYHADRGTDVTTYADPQIQFAIVRASQYLDLRFEYIGERSNSAQELEWPRQFAFNDRGDTISGLPTAVKQATAEYSFRALLASLMADPSAIDGTGRSVKKLEQTVGPITEKYEYENDRGYEMPEYPLADRILTSKGLITSGASGSSKGGLMVGNLARGN